MNMAKQLNHEKASKLGQFQSEVEALTGDNEVLKHYLAEGCKYTEDGLLVQISRPENVESIITAMESQASEQNPLDIVSGESGAGKL